MLTILVIVLYYAGKIMSIRIAHKTGKITLDTFFDDYNREEVIKDMQEEYEVEETFETEDNILQEEQIIDEELNEELDLDKPLLNEEEKE